MPSSSLSSRIRQASGASCGYNLPPGNSHNPAIGLPSGRLASNIRSSASTRATLATYVSGKNVCSSSGPQAENMVCLQMSDQLRWKHSYLSLMHLLNIAERRTLAKHADTMVLAPAEERRQHLLINSSTIMR